MVYSWIWFKVFHEALYIWVLCEAPTEQHIVLGIRPKEVCNKIHFMQYENCKKNLIH